MGEEAVPDMARPPPKRRKKEAQKSKLMISYDHCSAPPRLHVQHGLDAQGAVRPPVDQIAQLDHEQPCSFSFLNALGK